MHCHAVPAASSDQWGQAGATEPIFFEQLVSVVGDAVEDAELTAEQLADVGWAVSMAGVFRSGFAAKIAVALGEAGMGTLSAAQLGNVAAAFATDTEHGEQMVRKVTLKWKLFCCASCCDEIRDF
jgi:hypothetical protein